MGVCGLLSLGSRLPRMKLAAMLEAAIQGCAQGEIEAALRVFFLLEIGIQVIRRFVCL